jgi:cellulose biosynthesis protein BcsQ
VIFIQKISKSEGNYIEYRVVILDHAYSLMAPTHSVCVANNRGGVGKTFATFQVACAAAYAEPEKKVLVIDFSIYSHLSAMLLGGTAAKSALSAPTGLQTCRSQTTADTRVEGLIRALDSVASTGGKKRQGLFNFLGKGVSTEINLMDFAIQPSKFNVAIPSNLYLIASAGTPSWTRHNEAEVPLWCRSNEDWIGVAEHLRYSIDALPIDFDALFVDTDHLASSVFTRLALATCDSVVVPCSTDTADFQRLYETADAAQFNGVESLFTDVMMAMDRAGQLRARVKCMFFAAVASVKNDPTTTTCGISLPFKPTISMMANMDCLAKMAYETCDKFPQYRMLFGIEYGMPSFETFLGTVFSASKMVPDLAKNISTLNGVPICGMTSQTYMAANGLTGSSGVDVLDKLRTEINTLLGRIVKM